MEAVQFLSVGRKYTQNIRFSNINQTFIIWDGVVGAFVL